MQRRLTSIAVALLGLLIVSMPAEAQRYPLAPTVSGGEHLHPFFEGWFLNDDGTKSFSFGYFNRNTDDLHMYIPRGPDNFIEPAEFDGMQPEHFTVRRERGIFVVTVPEDWGFEEPVVWTLRNSGGEYAVPATWRSEFYNIPFEMASGSMGPYLSFSEGGEEASGITHPVFAEPMETSVGEPMELRIWGRDRISETAARELGPATVTVYTHQGPALATVEAVRPEEDIEDAQDIDDSGQIRFQRQADPNEFQFEVGATDPAVFMVSFDQAGEYLLRVSIDNSTAVDSSSGNQCCWTNGYVPVTVTD